MLKLMELNIQLFAHKKGQGSTKNGRDSISKRLGAKAADGQVVSQLVHKARGRQLLRPALAANQERLQHGFRHSRRLPLRLEDLSEIQEKEIKAGSIN